MSVTTPPRRPQTEHDPDLERRVADLEALIEEARRRARRRRIRNGAAFVVAAAAGVVGLIGFHGGGGSGAGPAALAGASGAPGQSTKPGPSLAPLPAGNQATAFAFDPLRPSVVFVASPHARGGVYVHKTIDSGGHWLSTGARGTGWVSDILSLTSDPRHPGTLYAGTDTAVYKTVDGGSSWRPFNRGLFPPNGGKRFCYADSVGRYCVKLPYGTPGQPNWNRGNGWVLDVAVDPVHNNVLYAAADGVRKSTDGGRTWKAVFAPTRGRYHVLSRIAIAATRPESIYAIAHDTRNGDTAIYKSTDAGKTWQVTGGPGASLPPSCCGEDALAVDPRNPQTLYAVIGNTVLATNDGGASWHPSANGLPANDVTSLTVDPKQSGTLYVSIQNNLGHVYPTNAVEKPTGAIYKTTDGGQTWSEVYAGFGVETVAVDPARPSTIYGGGWARWDKTRGDTFGLIRSTDGGRTWTVAGG